MSQSPSRYLHPASRLRMLALCSLLLGLCLAVTSMREVRGQQQTEESPNMLRHVVLFQFKDSSSEADIQQVVDAFRALPKKISQIADFEYGVNNSPEGLAGGLTHCFLVTFKTEADRDAYLPHPEHKAFVEVLKPHLEKATVVDYWAKH
jgi:hypothetical protein